MEPPWKHNHSLRRTNNAMEGFHKALRGRFQKEHPSLSRLIQYNTHCMAIQRELPCSVIPFALLIIIFFAFRLISVLKDEEELAKDRLRAYQLDTTVGINLRKRAQTYVRNDRPLRQLVTIYDAINNPTDEQIMQFITAIQY